MKTICYGPADPGEGRADAKSLPPDVVLVPASYKGQDESTLQRLGLTFGRADFSEGDKGIELFLQDGVVSLDRTMAVLFCDLKGSTAALNCLSPQAFRDLQNRFFCACAEAVAKANAHHHPGGLRAVIDKYMGDSAMIYVDIGDTKQRAEPATEGAFAERERKAPRVVVEIIRSIALAIHALDEKHSPRLEGARLGARFGVAMGDGIILSVLGGKTEGGQRTIGDFTLTGPVVNLAARLEHAAPAEFLECIAQSRRQIESHTALVWEKERLRSTRLGEELLRIDTQIAELYEVCSLNFEIRADARFVAMYEADGEGPRMPWKAIPFSPRGFSHRRAAMLLGGNSVAELLRRI